MAKMPTVLPPPLPPGEAETTRTRKSSPDALILRGIHVVIKTILDEVALPS